MRTKVLSYSAVFTPEKEGGFSVSFPDFPEAHSQGDNLEDAYRMAIDCLNAAIAWRLEEKSEIPLPGRVRRGQYAVPVSLDLAPKLALYQTMRDRRVSNVKLAQQLRVSELIVRRMLNPRHKSKPEQYVRALRALGQTLEVSVVSRS